MDEFETLSIRIEADTRSLDAAVKRIEQSVTSLLGKLEIEFGALNVRLGALSETISGFRSQADGAANAVGRLVVGLGKLSRSPLVQVSGHVLGSVDLGKSEFESRFAKRFAQDPTTLRDQFLVLSKRIATLERVSEEVRAFSGADKEIADNRVRIREIAGTLGAQASIVAANLRNAAGPELEIPDTPVTQDLRRRLGELVAILEEIERATSDPQIRSFIEGVRLRPNTDPDLSDALGISGSDNVEILIGSGDEGALRARQRSALEPREPRRVQLASSESGPLSDTDIVNDLAAAQELLTDAVERSGRSLQMQATTLRDLNGAARDLGFTFASSFEDAVVEGRRLSDVLQGLEQDILRILTRKLVTEPLAGAVTGQVGTGLGVLSGEIHGGGRVGSTPVPGRVVPASFFAGAPRFAGGEPIIFQPRILILRKRVKNLFMPWYSIKASISQTR